MSVCVVCNKEKESGVITNGDGYGDAKYVGIVPPEWAFYCWDCYDQAAPDLSKRIDEAFVREGMCGFLEAWIGRCREPEPCPKHSGQKCWKCGERATSNCPETFSLVCGVPQCAKHPHEHKMEGWK